MKQLTEDYVSYEIAKLLKEKGFDECVYTCYTVDDYPLFMEMIDYVVQDEIYERIGNDCHIIQAPTHQMAIAWILEKYNVYIEVSALKHDYWVYVIYKIFDNKVEELYNEGSFKSHEDAVEAALLYVLKNLI